MLVLLLHLVVLVAAAQQGGGGGDDDEFDDEYGQITFDDPAAQVQAMLREAAADAGVAGAAPPLEELFSGAPLAASVRTRAAGGVALLALALELVVGVGIARWAAHVNAPSREERLLVRARIVHTRNAVKFNTPDTFAKSSIAKRKANACEKRVEAMRAARQADPRCARARAVATWTRRLRPLALMLAVKTGYDTALPLARLPSSWCAGWIGLWPLHPVLVFPRWRSGMPYGSIGAVPYALVCAWAAKKLCALVFTSLPRWWRRRRLAAAAAAAPAASAPAAEPAAAGEAYEPEKQTVGGDAARYEAMLAQFRQKGEGDAAADAAAKKKQ